MKNKAVMRAKYRRSVMSSFQHLVVFLFSAALLSGRSEAAQREFDHRVDLPSTRPLVVAHRGSSGTLPEHTVAAYQLAVDQGADVVECDVTISKDLVLLCSHEAWINDTTNVSDVYNETRMSTYYVPDQRRNITDYFTVDFTMEELRRIGRRQRQRFRDPNYDDQLPIATLEDLVKVTRAAGRPVGIYVETKDPDFINSLSIIRTANTTFEDLLLKALDGFGFNSERSPCFIQSFDEQSLRYLADRTSLPLVMLFSDDKTDEDLTRYAAFAYGIGPSKEQIVRVNVQRKISERTDLVERAHALGLRVHPYTFRNEHQYLAWDYGQDPYNEYADFFNISVDGLFTDFPGTYFNFLNQNYLAFSVSMKFSPNLLSIAFAFCYSFHFSKYFHFLF